jgi:hypothetical protein
MTEFRTRYVIFATAFLLAAGAQAAEVARVFGNAVSAEDLKWRAGEAPTQAARQLREMALKEAGMRFMAANNLKATPEEIAAYGRWEAQFQLQDRERRVARLAQLEKASAPSEAERRELDVLRQLAKHDANRPAPSTQVHGWWIEGYKLKKALYEKYGGRVGITKWGPDPVGATEALLREHEKRGDLAIFDVALAREFWDSLAREPRMPATRPEHLDFTYFWLKPPPSK